jgi:cytochrome c
MKSTLSLLLALSSLAAAPAFANPELAKQKLCMTCHDVSDKKLGPSYKQVAATYAGQKDAVDKLTQKVIKGTLAVPPGKPVFGNVPMPANTQVSPAEAKQLVTWILSIK